MRRKWAVVLENGRTDYREMDRFWTRRGANGYVRWLRRRFSKTLAKFYDSGYRLYVRRLP